MPKQVCGRKLQKRRENCSVSDSPQPRRRTHQTSRHRVLRDSEPISVTRSFCRETEQVSGLEAIGSFGRYLPAPLHVPSSLQATPSGTLWGKRAMNPFSSNNLTIALPNLNPNESKIPDHECIPALLNMSNTFGHEMKPKPGRQCGTCNMQQALGVSTLATRMTVTGNKSYCP